MKIHKQIQKLTFIIGLLNPIIIHCIDNPHFWRATNFLPEFYEPRLAKPWLSSADAMLGFGGTHTAGNKNGNNVPLLDIYGPFNMQTLGLNIPGTQLNNPNDLALAQLAGLPANDGFGMIRYEGEFRITELNLSVSQNLIEGFFIQAHIPARRFAISDITFTDLSPTVGNPNASNPAWQNFLALFPEILNQYELSTSRSSASGFGDLSILGGWTNNYEETEDLDYIDTTIRAGVLFPTGDKKNINKIFSLANGYNGHYAIPVSFDTAIGWYEWCTAGLHVGAMPFLKRTQELRLKTDYAQSGLIKLARGTAHVHPGTIWETNLYLKADHMLCGFSFLLGYSYATKNHDTITPLNTALFNQAIINTDEEFLGWQMHTLNFLFDYDFAKYEKPYLPHAGFFYNLIVGGKRIFNTNVGGLAMGVTIACEF